MQENHGRTHPDLFITFTLNEGDPLFKDLKLEVNQNIRDRG